MVSSINSVDRIHVSYSDRSSVGLIEKVTQETSASNRRSSMRRMRTETYVVPPVVNPLEKNSNQILIMLEKLDASIRKENYAEGLKTLKEIDEFLKGPFLEEVISFLQQNFFIDPSLARSAFNHIEVGYVSEIQAYLMALQGDSNAIEVSDFGYENLRAGVNDLMQIIKQIDIESGVSDQQEMERFIYTNHHLLRGLLAFALDKREMAIEDLRAAYATHDDSDIVEPYLVAKILENKLQASLLPELTVNDNDPISLFIAGRYEEALLLSQSNSDDDNISVQGACLAMLGRYDEAIDLFQRNGQNRADLGGASGCALVYLLKGDFEKAKELGFQSIDEATGMSFGYLIPLMAR